MRVRSLAAACLVVCTICFAAFFVFVSPSSAQTSSTGALTGTVSDPSGGVVVGATVTVTNNATGQARTATTDSSGVYTIGLLTPGNYKVTVSAAGFKGVEVPSVTVNVTETPVLNEKLEIGGQATQVTVESTAETVQTTNATVGAVVGAQEVVDLPLVSRNYTQIADLSPGVVTNVSNAAAVGNGTQDINVNGSRSNQNNYTMDGASITDYVSGTAAQTGSFPGIAIPNPDTIQEFKVQTSQYDAGYGRNPGANVSVITKTGGNDFHGTAFEFNRNNMFNANDFFYHESEINNHQPNKPQTLKQNTFGGTLGGHIIKDKLFFFGSYQGFRQINGIGTSGFSSGYESAVNLLPWNDPNDPSDPRHLTGPAFGAGSYRNYLGSVFGGNTGVSTGVTIAPDGSNISNTALALLQAPGIIKGGYNQGFYLPSSLPGCTLKTAGVASSGCVTAISQPTLANENQYMGNGQWNIDPKNTLEARYLYSSDPQIQSFLCFITPNSCNPGSPEDVLYLSHTATLKLTTILTSNLVNEARVTYQRNVEDATDPNNVLSCSLSSTAYIIPLINNGGPCPGATTDPLNREQTVVPIIDVLGIATPSGGWGQGGNFSATSQNFINTFQWADQISWTHGKQTIRSGFDAERIYYNNTIFASSRGEVLFDNVADLLTSSAGPAGTNPADPTYNDGVPATVVTGTPNPACFLAQDNLCGGGADPIALKGALTHNNVINAFDGFVQDDIKVTRKLSVNLGVRWEYDGWPDDTSGQFGNDWVSLAEQVNTGSFFLDQGECGASGNPIGTLQGFVVPSNFDVKKFGLTGPCGVSGVKVNSNKTLLPGSPWHNFAPRIGVAWQPLGDKFVVRAGYGVFYDRVYGNLLIDNQLNLPPYSGAGVGPFPSSLEGTLHNPYESAVGPLVWTPRWIECGTVGITAVGPGACTTDPTTQSFSSSAFGYTSDAEQMANRLPLIQQYNLDLQYELAHSWVVDIGYVGSHSMHLYNWSQDINIANLVAGAPNGPTKLQDQRLVSASLPFNDPANLFPVTVNTTGNVDERVSLLGYSPTGFASTNTNGDGLYNSLQLQLRHQFSHGLLMQASYTWSRDITNVNSSEGGSGINPPGNVNYGATNSNNPLDLSQQYGPAAFNRSQRFVVSYVYDLPIRKMEGWQGRAFNGWSVSGITTAQDGEPFSVVDGAGGTIYGTLISRAALADPSTCDKQGVCNSNIPIATPGSNKDRVATGWINTAAFTPLTTSPFSPTPLPASSPYCIGGIPQAGSSTAICGSAGSPFFLAGTGFGDSKIGSILGPGQWNWDLSILKDTRITEGTNLQFRAEFYNIWNHAQFAPPAGNDINGASFGIVNATSVTPRVVQFALKFQF
jgi:Carboxypeptidase regulatory-like domain/TonB-dependent Receptor Plug Domain